MNACTWQSLKNGAEVAQQFRSQRAKDLCRSKQTPKAHIADSVSARIPAGLRYSC
jgi:hypothetical protein